MYVAGLFRDTATFGATTLTSVNGSNDVFVAKLTSNGVYQWAVRAGGAGQEYGVSIAVDSSGYVVVTGGFGSQTITFGATTLSNAANVGTTSLDVFVAKLTPTGTWQWAVGAGGNGNDACTDVALDGSGNAVVTGEFSSPTITLGNTILANAGSIIRDSFVGKLTPTGVWQWAQRVGGSGIASAERVAVDSSGNAVITGYFSSRIVTFGATTLLSAGLTDIFVAKLTPTGAWQWAARAGENDVDTGIDVAVDHSGNVLLTGGYSSVSITFGTILLTNAGMNNRTVFVAKLTPTGVWQWATNTGGTASDFVQSIAADAGGNAIIAGYFSGPNITFGPIRLANAGRRDIFVASLSSTGAWRWATRVGGSGDDSTYGVILTGSGGHAVLTGGFTSPTLAFGSTTLSSQGILAIFLASLSCTTGLPDDDNSPNQPQLTLTPNPAHTTVQLTGATGATATLLDGLGRAVGTASVGPDGTATLDVRALAPGLYLLRAGRATRRLVVE